MSEPEGTTHVRKGRLVGCSVFAAIVIAAAILAAVGWKYLL